MIYFKIDGLFTKTTANKIVAAMDGKTYMNFHVYASNYAGNYTICVETAYDTTEEKAKGFFVNAALSTLAA